MGVEREAGEFLKPTTATATRPGIILPTGEPQGNSPYNMETGYSDFIKSYLKAPRPVPTTIGPLDAMLRGGLRPGLHVIGGNTGAGKTAFALWVLEKVASCTDPDTGRPYGVGFVSLELSTWEVRARLGSRLSHALDELEPYSWGDFEALGAKARKGMAEGVYQECLDPVCMADTALRAMCPNVALFDGLRTKHPYGDGENYHPPHRANTLEDVKGAIEWLGRWGGKLCFVDYLQCIEVDPDRPGRADEQQDLKRIAGELNAVGIETGVAVVGISAVSRAKGNDMRHGKESKNPGTDIFRGSSWIEYTGLTCFALVNREGAPTSGGSRQVELWPVKNRRGDTGMIELGYCGEFGEFTYLEPKGPSVWEAA